MQGLIGLVLLGVLGWLVIGWLKPPEYTASFYYNPEDLTGSWTQGGFASLDDCREWVGLQVSRDLDGYYDYECGKNCEYKDGLSVLVCDTTER